MIIFNFSPSHHTTANSPDKVSQVANANAATA